MHRGFYIGRFQPYHGGHHGVIKRIAETVDELVVGIGSADKSHTEQNPFTAGERHVMLTRALADVDLTPYIVPLQDINRNALWVSHVCSMCPPFDVAFSNNALVLQLLEEAGIEARQGPVFDRSKYRGTLIRQRMIAEEPWEDLVPDPVVQTIREFDGGYRLREVSKGDVFER